MFKLMRICFCQNFSKVFKKTKKTYGVSDVGLLGHSELLDLKRNLNFLNFENFN